MFHRAVCDRGKCHTRRVIHDLIGQAESHKTGANHPHPQQLASGLSFL